MVIFRSTCRNWILCKLTKMGRKVVLATCALNQWAMDFDGNLKRILKSKFVCTPTRIITMQTQMQCVSIFQCLLPVLFCAAGYFFCAPVLRSFISMSWVHGVCAVVMNGCVMWCVCWMGEAYGISIQGGPKKVTLIIFAVTLSTASQFW